VTAQARFDAGPQPGGRPPAPGRLAYVQAFCNSFWVDGAEGWPDDAAYAAWLRARGFTAPGDRAAALALREAVRAGLRDPAALGAIEAPPVRVDLAAGRLDSDDPLGLVVALLAEARLRGELGRLKACPHEHCGWVFWDGSRNRSAQWCSMRVCGSRTKAASYRRRARQGDRSVTPNTER
jgi:hypothetical protein